MSFPRIPILASVSLLAAGCGLILEEDRAAPDASTLDASPGDAVTGDGPIPDRTSVFVLVPSDSGCPDGAVYDPVENGCLFVNTGSHPVDVPVPLPEYTEVWGRARGLQQKSPDAFAPDGTTIDEIYVDGISITTGSPRRHVFTLAAGLNIPVSPGGGNACPCDGSTREPPAFMGDDWVCETGNDSDEYDFDDLYSPDVLWDDDAEGGSTCTPLGPGGEFHVTLDPPASGPLEVRFLLDQGDDDYLVTELELWVR